MRLTEEDTFAKMLSQLDSRVSDLESAQDVDEVPIQIRTVDETEHIEDSTARSVDTDPGWQWGSSRWGYDTWG